MRNHFLIFKNFVLQLIFFYILMASPADVNVPSFGARFPSAQDSFEIRWDGPSWKMRTTHTFQVVVHPLLRNTSPIQPQAFRAIQDLNADLVRFVPWTTYPRLAVPALEPGKWDFSLIDPLVNFFSTATRGHSTVWNFSTLPHWMFSDEPYVWLADDPNFAIKYGYKGTVFKDPSFKEVAQYIGRIYSWYAEGGFLDEKGNWRGSGHRYPISNWEVLNEPDYERMVSPQNYAALYDQVVLKLKSINPKLEFTALSLGEPENHPEHFRYFLNRGNHAPGVPLDWISWHSYPTATTEELVSQGPDVFFKRADQFLDRVDGILKIRDQLAPSTRTSINELSTMLKDAHGEASNPVIPAYYWNLSAAVQMHMMLKLSEKGIDSVGMSQIISAPGEYPSITMLDWKTGKPNARYFALKLLIDNLKPGDRCFSSGSNVGPSLSVFGSQGADGKRRTFLINRRMEPLVVRRLSSAPARLIQVALGQEGPPSWIKVSGNDLRLGGFAFAVLEE